MNKGRYNRYNYRNKHPDDPNNKGDKTDDTIFEAPYINLDDLGSIFIYLKAKAKFGDDKYICFYRSSVKEWLDTDPKKI